MADFAVFITLQDLGYSKPTIGDAIDISKGINRRAGTPILAKLNIDVCLAQFTHDPKTISSTQTWVISQIISARRQEELAQKLRDEQVHKRPLVHRAQMLAAIKLVAMFGSDKGGNVFQTRDDFDVLGELALTINSLYDFGNLKSPSDERKTVQEIAQQMGPLFELNNPEAPNNGMVRIREMLGEILERQKWRKQLKDHELCLKMADQFERIFAFITGAGFETYQDMTFAVYSYYFGNRQEILDGTASIAFSPSGPESEVSAGAIKGFLEQSSFSLDDMVGSPDRTEYDNRLLLDYTYLRKKPILKLEEEQYICVDPGLLLEKLTSGFFWSVMNALGEGGEDEDRSRTLAFSRLWGSLFEEYVVRRLVDAYGTGPCSPLLLRPEFDDGNEAFDAAIDFGESLIVVQIKGLFVPVDAKFAGIADKFVEGVSDKFGLQRGAALEQHLRNIQLAFVDDARSRRSIVGLDLSSKRLVFPLVITQERLLRLGLVTKILNDDFMANVESLRLRPGVRIQRPVFLTIDELESLVPYLVEGELTLLDALSTTLREDRNGFRSYWDVFNEDILGRKRIARRENLLLKTRWEELRNQSLRRFGSGYYSN